MRLTGSFHTTVTQARSVDGASPRSVSTSSTGTTCDPVIPAMVPSSGGGVRSAPAGRCRSDEQEPMVDRVGRDDTEPLPQVGEAPVELAEHLGLDHPQRLL